VNGATPVNAKNTLGNGDPEQTAPPPETTAEGNGVTETVAVFVNCTAAQEPDALEASTLNVVVDASAAV
jgi:hypothetical protein